MDKDDDPINSGDEGNPSRNSIDNFSNQSVSNLSAGQDSFDSLDLQRRHPKPSLSNSTHHKLSCDICEFHSEA